MTESHLPSQDATEAALTFTAGGKTYCVQATSVLSVTDAVAITALPGQAPSSITGFVNFHGQLAPVLNLIDREACAEDQMIFVDFGSRVVALLINQVDEIKKVSLPKNEGLDFSLKDLDSGELLSFNVGDYFLGAH
ncbi:MAG TPA: chemotaxis protein CheW [Oculatellaceae cyanobacterium]